MKKHETVAIAAASVLLAVGVVTAVILATRDNTPPDSSKEPSPSPVSPPPPSPSTSPSPSPSQAAPPRVAAVEDLAGDVSATQSGETFAAFRGLALARNDAVSTGAQSWTSLELGEGQYILVEEHTSLQVGEYALNEGKVWVNTNSPLAVTTPNAALAVRGTVFSVRHAGGVTRLAVFGGTVSIGGTDVSDGAAEVDAGGELSLLPLTEEDYYSHIDDPRLQGWLDQTPDDAVPFADPNFEAAVRALIDKPEGYILKGDVAGITRLSLSYSEIESLSGIECFTALAELDCRVNNITELNLRGLSSLTWLACSSNGLTSLDLTGLTALTELHCSSNNLTLLNLTGLTALTNLHCGGNSLTGLDLSDNAALTSLGCEYNLLSELDLSRQTALTSLRCYNNRLTELDLSACGDIIELRADPEVRIIR
ncbi:MAG: FecR domain-containing protein [Oscillospiraceae bacterium]|jgi:hypothetical protein|nr:FecR domain-containing protein [Oscillospiraceae bacterium]